ncbi:casein kinase [Stylonychia lemnae]|uniref:Casein kinase I n=1 Tax=Stylonychia lemnae TaxID=5949 RepID=A0A078AKC9_STYLE|nr:casein kinase [Stylonychia lemnae]|eukprot:CDW82840.1 casein kinase [Stylonychia lemnae]
MDRVGQIYKLSRKIGSGSFGDIYIGIHGKTGEEVAVKMEPMKTKYPQLLFESKLYKMMQGSIGIPAVHWYGQEGDMNCMIMDLLDKSLEDLFQQQKRKFSLKTVLMLADQMIQRVELVHSHNFLHRDIKPENFLMGRDPKGSRKKILSTTVHLIDFGLAKRFKDPKTGAHIPMKDRKELTGTARYASASAHEGYEQSRRDDLESLGFLLVYFLKGQLPWQGLATRNTIDKTEQIREKKMNTTIEELTEDLDEEFKQYFTYIRSLAFEDKPDYQYLRNLFKKLMDKNDYYYDNQFDWIAPKSSSKVSPIKNFIQQLPIKSARDLLEVRRQMKQSFIMSPKNDEIKKPGVFFNQNKSSAQLKPHVQGTARKQSISPINEKDIMPRKQNVVSKEVEQIKQKIDQKIRKDYQTIIDPLIQGLKDVKEQKDSKIQKSASKPRINQLKSQKLVKVPSSEQNMNKSQLINRSTFIKPVLKDLDKSQGLSKDRSINNTLTKSSFLSTKNVPSSKGKQRSRQQNTLFGFQSSTSKNQTQFNVAYTKTTESTDESLAKTYNFKNILAHHENNANLINTQNLQNFVPSYKRIANDSTGVKNVLTYPEEITAENISPRPSHQPVLQDKYKKIMMIID